LEPLGSEASPVDDSSRLALGLPRQAWRAAEGWRAPRALRDYAASRF
jgi:hypothetical protein